jgi:hypothetical protein
LIFLKVQNIYSLAGRGFITCREFLVGKFLIFSLFSCEIMNWIRCVGEVRRLAAGGGHSAVLTDARSLKELCEFRLAESLNLTNSHLIEDVASRTAADSLARLCQRLRYQILSDV